MLACLRLHRVRGVHVLEEVRHDLHSWLALHLLEGEGTKQARQQRPGRVRALALGAW